MSGVLRAVYPPNYYIIPEHHIRLSDDRTELMFEQHLPGVRREELNVEVLEKSICLNFQPVGKDPISRCYSLPYRVVPTTAEGAFREGRLEIRVRLEDVLGSGKRLELL